MGKGRELKNWIFEHAGHFGDPQWFQTRTTGIQHAWKTHHNRFAKVNANERESLDK